MALTGVVLPRVLSALRGRSCTTTLARPTRLATVLRYSISCSFSSCRAEENLTSRRVPVRHRVLMSPISLTACQSFSNPQWQKLIGQSWWGACRVCLLTALWKAHISTLNMPMLVSTAITVTVNFVKMSGRLDWSLGTAGVLFEQGSRPLTASLMHRSCANVCVFKVCVPEQDWLTAKFKCSF